MQIDWVRRYHGPFSGTDRAKAIVVDDSANVYVTGGSQRTSSAFECVTIKYSKSGDTLWIMSYYTTGNPVGNDIKLDRDNNVYVACGDILKYSSNGVALWQRHDDTSSYRKIVLDSLGNVYAGGIQPYRLITGKFDNNGTQIWRKKYTFTGSAAMDLFGDLAMDNKGNVIITGQSKATGTFYDYATIKYSNNGNEVWSRRYNGPSSYSDDGAYGVTSDINGNIYVTGYSMDVSNNDNCLTIKYDSSGNTIWVKRIASAENIANIGYNLLTDSSQNVFIAGRLGGRTSTIKLDVNGNIIWNKIYPQGNVLTANYPVIILDSVYNVYVTAISTSTGPADYAAIKYDSSGNQIYSVTYNYLSIGADYVNDMAIDKGGILYLTGETQSGGGYAFTTVKFSPIKTGISNSLSNPEYYNLEQNYPNPFNPKTIISYQLSKINFVELKVYDVLGNEVATIVNQKQSAGSYNVEFNGSNLSSGIYFYRLETDGKIIDTKRMVLLK